MMGNHSSWAGTAESAFLLSRIGLRIKRSSVVKILFFLGMGLYLSTAFVNIGIIALDDYEFGIARTIPAQYISYAYIIAERAIRTPVPTLVLASLGKLGLSLGILDPAMQLKFVLLVIGFFSFCAQSYFVTRHFKETKGGTDYRREISLFLIACFFLCPLFYTRPLVENLASPFLTMSAYFACVYFSKGKRLSLSFAILSLMVAAMLRFQAGVCFIGLISIVAWRKNAKDWMTLVLVGTVCFFFSGAVDWFLTGHFHGSLVSYVDYNVKFSSVYGVQPFYVFIALFLALTVPPTLISKYRGMKWKEEYKFLVPTLIYFLAFLVAHSFVPHKEERFMVPVLALFLVLLTPLFNYILQAGWKQWRVGYFLSVNFILLPFASYNVAQNNTIGLMRYFHEHREIKTVVGVEDTLLLFPKAFSLNPVDHIRMSAEDVDQLTGGTCDSVIAIRQDLKGHLSNLEDSYRMIAEFKPGFLEYMLVKMNPKRNGRRGAIELYGDKNCQY